MKLELIFIELLVMAVLLGIFIAHKRSIGERLVLFCTVPLSFLIAFLIGKLGVFDGIAAAIGNTVTSVASVSNFVQNSSAAKTGITALIAALLRPFAVTLVFWLLLIVTKIITKIVVKKNSAKPFFTPAQKAFDKKNIIACAISAVGAFLIFMFSCLPLNFVMNFAEEALVKAEGEAYADTWIQENALKINQNYLPTSKDAVFGNIQKYTGMKAILNGVGNSLSTVSLTDNDGHKVTFNAAGLLQIITSDAVDALAVWEIIASPEHHTLSDIAMITNPVSTLADSPLIMTVVTEMIQSYEMKDGDDAVNTFIAAAKEKYTLDNVDNLHDDVKCIAAALDTVIEAGGDNEIKSDDLLELIIEPLSNEDNAYAMISELSKMSIYSKTLTSFTEYGIRVLCDNLMISENKEDAYDDFLNAVREEINDRSHGTFDRAKAEAFIVYAAQNGVKPSNYVVKDEENLTERDIQFKNYQRYMTRKTAVEKAFSDYKIAENDGKTFTVTLDGAVYYYNDATFVWKRGDSGLNGLGLLADYLVYSSNDKFESDMEYTFEFEDIEALAKAYEKSAAKPSALFNLSLTYAKFLYDGEGYAPEGVTYSDEIVSLITEKTSFNDKDNRAAAKAIASAAGFARGLFSAGDNTAIQAVLKNFSLVGRLLDSLCEFEITSKVPSKLLVVTSDHPEFGKYFLSESIVELTEKVNEGEASYESLFGSVQAIYNIIENVIS